jgi:hypothetical protein
MTREELRILSKENRKSLNDLQPYIDKINNIKLREKKIQAILVPRFNIITFEDNKTGNRYFQAKVYWPDSNGELKRSETFSLGNVNDYPQGINGYIAGEKITNLLIKRFGNEIK